MINARARQYMPHPSSTTSHADGEGGASDTALSASSVSGSDSEDEGGVSDSDSSDLERRASPAGQASVKAAPKPTGSDKPGATVPSAAEAPKGGPLAPVRTYGMEGPMGMAPRVTPAVPGLGGWKTEVASRVFGGAGSQGTGKAYLDSENESTDEEAAAISKKARTMVAKRKKAAQEGDDHAGVANGGTVAEEADNDDDDDDFFVGVDDDDDARRGAGGSDGGSQSGSSGSDGEEEEADDAAVGSTRKRKAQGPPSGRAVAALPHFHDEVIESSDDEEDGGFGRRRAKPWLDNKRQRHETFVDKRYRSADWAGPRTSR